MNPAENQAFRPLSGLEASTLHGAPLLDCIEASRLRLHAACDPASVADDLLREVARVVEARRASLMLINPLTGRMRIVAAVGLPREMVGHDLVPATRRISDWVLRERRAVVVHGKVSDQRFDGSARDDPVESALSVPLVSARGGIGVLNLSRIRPATAFTPDDLAAVEAIAPPMTSLLEEVQEVEAARAGWRGRAASRGERRADTPGGDTRRYRVAMAHVESWRVGGDEVERVAHRDGGLTLMAMDVLGCSGAALAAGALVRGLFLAHARYNRSPAEIARLINEALAQHPAEHVQAYLWLAHLSADGLLVSCNAGYPAPLGLPGDGVEGTMLLVGGPTVGAQHDARYGEERLRMLPGDAVLVTSDGLLGACNAAGHAFGRARAHDSAREMRNHSLEHVAHALCEEAASHAGRIVPIDDMLVLLVRFTRED